MRAAILVLRATLVTGYWSNGCSLWADVNKKEALSELIRSIWSHVGRRVGQKQGHRDQKVAAEPTRAEAKKVSSIYFCNRPRAGVL